MIDRARIVKLVRSGQAHLVTVGTKELLAEACRDPGGHGADVYNWAQRWYHFVYYPDCNPEPGAFDPATWLSVPGIGAARRRELSHGAEPRTRERNLLRRHCAAACAARLAGQPDRHVLLFALKGDTRATAWFDVLTGSEGFEAVNKCLPSLAGMHRSAAAIERVYAARGWLLRQPCLQDRVDQLVSLVYEGRAGEIRCTEEELMRMCSHGPAAEGAVTGAHYSWAYYYCSYPDPDEFDPDVIADTLADERYDALAAGARPTRKEVRLFQRTYAEAGVSDGDSCSGLYVCYMTDTRGRSVFFADDQGPTGLFGDASGFVSAGGFYTRFSRLLSDNLKEAHVEDVL
jgi:hypothetical protein